MYDKYGYIETAAEINKRAVELLAVGDRKGVLDLAEENGIEQEIAEVFCAGEVGYICDEESAAIGRIDVEMAEMPPQEIFKDWVEYIKSSVYKDKNMAIAIRKEDKSIEGCISKLLIWSFKNAYNVPSEILTEARKEIKGLPNTVKLGIPGMGTAKKIIREYFLN